MPQSSPSQAHGPVIQRFCRQVGASDLESYLGIQPSDSLASALHALESRRVYLERHLHEPRLAMEAEHLHEAFGAIRQALEQRQRVTPRTVDPNDLPVLDTTENLYDILEVTEHASFSELESAYRQADQASDDPGRVQAAWKILGDPAQRALYDAKRRKLDREASYSLPPFDPETQSLALTEAFPPNPEHNDEAHIVALGPPRARDVLLRGDKPLQIQVGVLVRGTACWQGLLESDHAAMIPLDGRRINLEPGRHQLTVRFDPAYMTSTTQLCVLSLSNAGDSACFSFRVHHEPAETIRWPRWMIFGSLAIMLVAAGWLLGNNTRIETAPLAPQVVTSELGQHPSLLQCLQSTPAPLPEHLDIHVDGFGRPQGFSFSTDASPEAFQCIRNLVPELSFQPGDNGQVLIHRFPLQGLP